MSTDDATVEAEAATDDDVNPPECSEHKEVQHRDGMPPWCNSCGWRHGQPAIPAKKIKTINPSKGA